MSNIKQLLVQASIARDAGDWSSLTQYLTEMMASIKLGSSDMAVNQEQLLGYALLVLEFGDFQQRWEIGKVFCRLGEIAINPLVGIIESDNAEEELRWCVARLLGELKHPKSITSLIKLCENSQDEELSTIAYSALGQIGTPAIPALIELLNHQNTKLLAVRALAYIRHSQVIPALLSVVEDEDFRVRATAIEALSSFHDYSIPPVLVKALDDINALVRREAVLGLGFRCDLSGELDLVTKLERKLYDIDIDVCCAAASSLGRIVGDKAASALYEVLVSHKVPQKLQIEAIRSLSWNGRSGLKYLKIAFKQIDSVFLWREIVSVLGRAQPQGHELLKSEILLEILESQHPAMNFPSVKQTLALCLGQLGNPQAIDPLLSLLKDKDIGVRLHAIAALKNLAPEYVEGIGSRE